MASQYASITNAISSFAPFVMQTFLTATSAVASSRTSHLKQKWLLRRNTEKSWKSVMRSLPWKTVIVSVLYFAVQMTIAVCRTYGILGFSVLPPPLKKVIISYYLQAFAVPLVTIATVSRMARRLSRRAAENRRITSVTTGIIEPRTVHGQALKIHFSDAGEKAKVLHMLQCRRIAKRNGDLESPDAFHSDEVSPEDIYATGIIAADEYSDSSTFVRLLGNLKHVRGTQLYRMLAQLVVLGIAFAVVGVEINKPARMSHPNFSLLTTTTFFLLLVLSSIIGFFYEVFAPSLADGNTSRVPVVLLWLFVQLSVFIFIGTLATVGMLGGQLSHVQVLLFLNLISCVLELLISEAWIAKAKHESAEFKVPSWAEIETMLATGDNAFSPSDDENET